MNIRVIRNTILSGSLLILVGVFHHSHTHDGHHADAPVPIHIGSTSDTIDLAKAVTEAYSTHHEAIAPQITEAKSADSLLEQIQSQTIDIATINRPLTNEEQKSVTYHPLTTIPLGIAIHQSVTNVMALNPEELQAIYQGEITNWQAVGGPDADIVVFDLAETTPAKTIFRQTYLGETPAITPNAVVLSNAQDCRDMAATTDFSIALVPLKAELETVPLNIVAVTDSSDSEAIESAIAQPAMEVPIGLIASQDASIDIQEFLDFVQSPEGQGPLAHH